MVVLDRNSKKDISRDMIWQPLLCRKLYEVVEKGTKVGSNGLVGGSHPGGVKTNELQRCACHHAMQC